VTALLTRLVDDDTEIVTVIIGAEARPGDTAHIREHLALAHPKSKPSSTTAANRFIPTLLVWSNPLL